MHLAPAAGEKREMDEDRLASRERGGRDLGSIELTTLLCQKLDGDGPRVARCHQLDLDRAGLTDIERIGQRDLDPEAPARQAEKRVDPDGDQDERPEIEGELP